MTGFYTGWGGSKASGLSVDPLGVEGWFLDLFFSVTMLEPVSELEQMAASASSLNMPWPPSAVGRWNSWEDERKVNGPEGMSLFSATKTLPHFVVAGAVSAVRNRLLEIALELQKADDAAGEKNGPTITEPQLGASITQFITNIYGTAPVAIGPGVTQTTTIDVGDLGGLLNAVRAAGLEDPAALGELAAAAGDEDKPSKLRAFLDKVGSDAYTFVTGVGGQVAKDLLTPMIEQYLGVK